MPAAIAVAALVGMLAGCADVRTDVHATASSGFADGERTYALARTRALSRDVGPVQIRYEALVREELARQGFMAAPADTAHYLVSLTYEARGAGVVVARAECAASDGCADPAARASGSRSSGSTVHSLTLRFFEGSSGREVYKVTASRRERDTDPASAIPYLVKSALARLPYQGHADWSIQFKDGNGSSDTGPDVVTVEPADASR
ncbi:DUF4136 domain-containing protein [Trinickia fusca]|nr:DUF4136 domain-containing protein [Trinickia fusca]